MLTIRRISARNAHKRPSLLSPIGRLTPGRLADRTLSEPFPAVTPLVHRIKKYFLYYITLTVTCQEENSIFLSNTAADIRLIDLVQLVDDLFRGKRARDHGVAEECLQRNFFAALRGRAHRKALSRDLHIQ